MKDTMTARERLQHQLDEWGANGLIPVSTDDLRELLIAERKAFAEGYNQCSADFRLGVTIEPEQP